MCQCVTFPKNRLMHFICKSEGRLTANVKSKYQLVSVTGDLSRGPALTRVSRDECTYEFEWYTAAACVQAKQTGNECTVFDKELGNTFPQLFIHGMVNCKLMLIWILLKIECHYLGTFVYTTYSLCPPTKLLLHESLPTSHSLYFHPIIDTVVSTLLVQYQHNISTVSMLLFFVCFDCLIPAMQPCDQAEIYWTALVPYSNPTQISCICTGTSLKVWDNLYWEPVLPPHYRLKNVWWVID